MKNESGINEEITMLDALQRLWYNKKAFFIQQTVYF